MYKGRELEFWSRPYHEYHLVMGRSIFEVDEDFLEYRGDYYCFFDDEFWIWNPKIEQWLSLDHQPDFLVIVNERAALIKLDTGEYYCNCPWLLVYRQGCKCGGV